MEQAIIDLEEQFLNTVKRLDDIEWKVESTQTYKNNNCESIVKLITESKSLSNNFESISSELTELDINLDDKRSKLRNAYLNYATNLDSLNRNVQAFQNSSPSTECNKN